MTETTTTDARWYAVQTYSGHENKVQRLILGRIEDQPEEERQIFEVLVPTQDVVEIKNGKRVTVTKRLYPGYVLVHMLLNDRTTHVINNRAASPHVVIEAALFRGSLSPAVLHG